MGYTGSAGAAAGAVQNDATRRPGSCAAAIRDLQRDDVVVGSPAGVAPPLNKGAVGIPTGILLGIARRIPAPRPADSLRLPTGMWGMPAAQERLPVLRQFAPGELVERGSHQTSLSAIKKAPQCGAFHMAESEGFEPPECHCFIRIL